MSVGMVAALAFAAVLVVVVLGLVWWVNRPIATGRAYSRQTLPLFSSDRFIDAEFIEDEEEDEEDAPATRDVSALRKGNVAVNTQSRAEAKSLPETPRTFSTSDGNAPMSARVSAARTSLQTPPRAATPILAAPHEVGAASGSTFNGQSVRFSVPTDGTLQFLPGRLEITAGSDLGREIRFVRFPGPDGSRVTFGRVEGPMYRHVQLHDATVSRRHATMDLVGSDWMLTNLSTTNPVVLNEKLLGEGETQLLADGDRVEMGEVVFRYRSR